MGVVVVFGIDYVIYKYFGFLGEDMKDFYEEVFREF